jgi:hypothetical protein
LIRAGEVEKAEKMAEQFTRENTTVQENLKEMQVLWFQIECAQAYYKQGIKKIQNKTRFYSKR